MMKSILAALLCIYFLGTALPAGAGETMQPPANPSERLPERAEPEKITPDELKAAQMMEMLNMLKMLQQLDLMEDYEIVGENENEKSS